MRYKVGDVHSVKECLIFSLFNVCVCMKKKNHVVQ